MPPVACRKHTDVLQTHLELAALATAPGCARDHVRAVAREWGLADLADTAQLLTSELVTNAVRASEHRRLQADLPSASVVRLWVIADASSLVIGVWDGSDEMPVYRGGTSNEESGRGLMLVGRLSKDWGAYREDGGKVVWAQISGERRPSGLTRSRLTLKVNGHPLFIAGRGAGRGAGGAGQGRLIFMRAGQASRTARQNALFRALEARRPGRVADDPVAAAFLTPEFRVLAEAARVPPARRFIESYIDRRWPCVRGGVVARTALIDRTVAAELPRAGQVLILGAGFDSRAYRLPEMRRARVFEVDHPDTQEAKRRGLLRRGPLPGHVTFVPVVFGRDDPARALAGAGFETGVPTLVLWEGVTNYLDQAAVDSTFAFLAGATGPGSPVLFTYVDRGMLNGSASFAGAQTTMRAVQRVGEPFTFGLVPQQVPAYLAGLGFALEWDVAVSDAAERIYPAGECPSVPAYYHVALSRRDADAAGGR